MSDLVRRNNRSLALPAVPEQMLPAIDALTRSLGIPRDVLASDEEIVYAWRDLPREIGAIPPTFRNEHIGELLARMCVAVGTGLFDGAINYVWNATILHLRHRVKDFGLPVVGQILQKDFEEKHLLELQDSQLLELCLKLNLITEDGFFFLDQCRDTRNNFSAAHPSIGKINDREFMAFLNRCVRYALSDETSPRGVDISSFISALKSARFKKGQREVWVERLIATHNAQRQLLIGMVHGIYCDPGSPEPTRLNAIDLCMDLKSTFTAAIKSDLIDRHSDYLAKGDTARHAASQQFFEKLGLLNLLNEAERHSLVVGAVQRLWDVHQGMNNFYNEPPFAERLQQLSEQGPIPETAQEQYVNVVVNCYIGNSYGVSWAAEPYYESMIREFSPREVAHMISLSNSDTALSKILRTDIIRKRRFVKAISLIDEATVPSKMKAEYDRWVKLIKSER